MSFKNKLGFSFYFLNKRLIKLLICIVLISLISIQIFLSVFMFDYANFTRTSIERSLKYPLTQVGRVGANEKWFDLGYDVDVEIIKKVRKLDCVEMFGIYCAGGFGDAVPELTRRLRDNSEELKKLDDYIGFPGFAYYAPPKMLDIMNVKLLDGEIISDEDLEKITDERNMGIYLGYAYRDIKVGTRLAFYDRECIVLGILDKGSRWLGQNVLQDDYLLNSNLAINADNICIVPELYNIPDMIVFKEGVSFDEGAEEVKKILEDYGIITEFESLETVCQRSIEVEKADNRMMFGIGYIIMIVSIIILIKLHMISIFKNRYEYGVLIASGAQIEDIRSLIILEKVILWLISIIPSVAISLCIIIYLYAFARANYISMFLDIAFNVTLWKFLLISGVVTAIMILVPVLYIRKKDVVSLMHEE